MGLLEKVSAAREAKSTTITFGGGQGFEEPPFWSLDNLRFGWRSHVQPDREEIENDFEGYIQGAYKASGIVFACILARQLVFSEARFQWTRFVNGRRADPFGTDELAILENPWPGGTTGEMLSKMLADADLAGNSYLTTADNAGRVGRAATGPGRRIVRMRPDWVSLVISSASRDPFALDARVVALMYEPPPTQFGQASVLLLPSEVAHYSPIPDPAARFRGMSWLTPVLREVAADRAATKHKLKFFENGATLQTVARLHESVSPDAFERFVEMFRAEHRGVDHAYETLFLGGGADMTVVGADMKQLDFKSTQGAGETRIAAAARIPPVILGISEGLAGSSLNAGNYGSARRSFADGTLRPLWRMAAASLQNLVTPPGAGVSLWYDARDIAFLREDAKDDAEIFQLVMTAISTGVTSGFDADAVVNAAAALDIKRLLGNHNGLPSVQQQQTTSPASANGNGSQPVPQEA